jgi:serpin B
VFRTKRSSKMTKFRLLTYLVIGSALFSCLTAARPAQSAKPGMKKVAAKKPVRPAIVKKPVPSKASRTKASPTTTKQPNRNQSATTQIAPSKTLSASDAFSLKLYKTLAKGSASTDNVIVSPYSIAEALSMVRGGALGNTAKELDDALNGGAAVDPTNRKNRRQDLLRERVGGSGTYVRVGNSLWLKNGYPLVPAFAELAKTPYAAKVESLELVSDPAGSAKKINSWISETTEKQIEQLVSPQDFNDLSRAVLVNAVLFHGKWFRPFDKSLTAAEPFIVGGQSIAIPTMHGIADVTPGTTASFISIPYTAEYRMRIAVPADGSPSSVDSAMDSLFTGPVQLGDQEQCAKIKITLPKWKNETKFDLIDPLKSLGINDLFIADRADLTGISPQAKVEGLYIAKAIHKATVTVDEEGTVAAAATALFAEAASAPLRAETCPTEFKVNHPFAYVIQHYVTGEVLFAGRILNPA